METIHVRGDELLTPMVVNVPLLNRRILVDKNTTLSVDILNLGSTQRLPTLLFVHGLGSNKTIWSETAESICRSRGYKCILVDLRGHGESSDFSTTDEIRLKSVNENSSLIGAISEESHHPYSLSQNADDLAVVIRTFLTHFDEWRLCSGTDSKPMCYNGTGKVIVNNLDVSDTVVAIGHSYGSNVALELCVRHHSLVSDIIFVDGGYVDLQRTFPDYNSCFLTLRPPSFAGVSADDLENTVRNIWALEGSGRSGVEAEDELVTRNTVFADKNLNHSANNGSTTGYNYCGHNKCWSERGIQAILKNFRVVTMNISTTLFRDGGDAVSSGFSNSNSSSSKKNHNNNTINNYNNNNSIFASVHTVLSFQCYVQLLEDLWHRRPCEQFMELMEQCTLTPPTLPLPLPPPLPLSPPPPLPLSLPPPFPLHLHLPLPPLSDLTASLATAAAAAAAAAAEEFNLSNPAHTCQWKRSINAQQILKKKSVLIIYAGTSSPFSLDKENDIRALLDVINKETIEAANGTESLTHSASGKSEVKILGLAGRVDLNTIGEEMKRVESYDMDAEQSGASSPLSVKVIAFPHCGHNIPLQVPDDLAAVIHSHLSSLSL